MGKNQKHTLQAYYDANKEIIKQRSKDWRIQNKEMYRAHKRSLKGQFSAGKASAKKRGIIWSLSFEEFSKLRSLSCYYCEGPLAETSASLDRIDNSKGYISGNVLPCCSRCNMTRGNNFTVEETRAMIQFILKYRKSLNNEQ